MGVRNRWFCGHERLGGVEILGLDDGVESGGRGRGRVLVCGRKVG